MQIIECVQRILRMTVSWTWRVAYYGNTMNGCEHYKVGQFQRRKEQFGASDSQPVSTFRYVRICYWLFKREFWAV